MELNKLTQDAKVAKVLAEAAHAAADDAGSANLDATWFPLEKGQRADGIVRAFLAAGLSASPTLWLGRGVMVQPPGIGMGNKRYAANQALSESLRRAGWPVITYCQMD